MKDIVGRPRPHQVQERIRTIDLAKAKPRVLALAKPVKEKMSDPDKGEIRGGSFPSDHAANNFTLATVFTAFYRRWGRLWIAPAMVILYSRVYVGSPYPFDVMGSAVMAVGISAFLLWAFARTWRKFAPKLFPAVSMSHPSIFT